jgi:predicted phage baseplate assembly protein
VFGNIVTAVRGQTVPREVLGSGDATVESQRFKLAKKPLTYVAAAGADNAAGVASTLTVWVDGLQWSEVPNFYGQTAGAQVYIVRQDDDRESFVTFGDGVRGARLTTGVDNVVASYRFGAGAASPPAGSIAQIAKPVRGLARVIGPVAAGGGEDAEDAESIRELAPRSALLLGRAISIEDFEVAARSSPGVTTAKADWTWDGTCQRPVVKVWIVAGPGVDATVAARLAAISDPNTPIFVENATPVTASLTIDLELDPRRVATDVLTAVEDALLGADGWLRPENLGIAEPLLRSPLLARLLSITGVTGVKGLTWNGSPFTGFGVEPGTGSYFDLTNDTAVTGS